MLSTLWALPLASMPYYSHIFYRVRMFTHITTVASLVMLVVTLKTLDVLVYATNVRWIPDSILYICIFHVTSDF